MNLKQLVLVGSLSTLVGTVQAMPTYDGSYSLVDATSTHGIWFNSSVGVGGSSDRTFNLTSGTFDATSGTTATLSGNSWSNSLGGGFNFSVDMTYRCTGTVLGGCGGLGTQPDGQVNQANVLGNDWDFWDYTDDGNNNGEYTLTGTGNLAGVSFTISQRPSDLSKPFRFGVGADWFNDFLLGGSGWFDVVGKSGGTNVSYANISRGDFNVTVPEPSIVALFGLGFLGLGILRRKARS